MNGYLWGGSLVALACLGAGCGRTAAPTEILTLPEVRIERPANEFKTTNASIDIVGSSNRPEIVVAGTSHLVIDSAFSVPVELAPGRNMIPIQAGNGYSTTTLHVTIHRLDATSTQP